MTFTPHGKHLIAGEWIGGGATFRSDPAHGPAHDFSVGTVAQVDLAAKAAEAAFWSYGYSTRAARAAFQVSIGPGRPKRSALAMARSSATQAITFEWVKCRRPPRVSQMPSSG